METTSARKSWLSLKTLAIIGLRIAAASPLGGSPNAVAVAGRAQAQARATTKWKPVIGDTWQIVLQNPIKVGKNGPTPDVKVWSIDLYDNDAATFKALKASGKKIICYFSAGSWENWRSDASSFKAADYGNDLDGWDGEKWLDTRTANVRSIMKKRIAYASQKGCDGIDPDNLDGYGNDSGFKLTKANGVDYIKFLSQVAASYKLSIGLKNCVDIVKQVLPSVDFATVEQCAEYNECQGYAPFIKAGKPVFQIEYPDDPASMSTNDFQSICPGDRSSPNYGFTAVIKNMNLDGWVQYCGQSRTYTTSTSR
ncbi:glycoside hydrolase superfamily [Dactylonectria estremocensis]|uniref:alpha-galactosidase n=1 Tax=Dactylonectria estremocensis TaxID=1079267 RepID=A0A9P9IME4_9HYPO|nr:glycoside hydrolase superfamily [Dactylonectria estremocensis]